MLMIMSLISMLATTSNDKEEEQNQTVRLHDVYSDKDVESVYDQYKFHLSSQIFDLRENRKSLVKDITVELDHENVSKNILVWDLGGSLFKLSYVTVSLTNGELKSEITEKRYISYPNAGEAISNTFWENWATDKMLTFVQDTKILPDSSSLIVSYPLVYDGTGDVRVERFTKSFCFNRSKAALSRRIMESVRSCIKTELTKIQESGDEKTKAVFGLQSSEGLEHCLQRLEVKTVLNDSVANHFSSKYKEPSYSISIILGTGTNAAFPIELEGEIYVFNSEWGAFSPNGIGYWKEENQCLARMREKFSVVNCLDVVGANGCKFDIVNMCIGDETRTICSENINEILAQEQDERTVLFKQLVIRSKQLISALTLGVISLFRFNKILIITNGSGFDSKKDIEQFVFILNKYKKLFGMNTIDFEIYADEGLTLKGSALYTFYHLLTDN